MTQEINKGLPSSSISFRYTAAYTILWTNYNGEDYSHSYGGNYTEKEMVEDFTERFNREFLPKNTAEIIKVRGFINYLVDTEQDIPNLSASDIDSLYEDYLTNCVVWA